jgi:hypothetical protein
MLTEPGKLSFETREFDGTRIKPGDHKGHPDEAYQVEITLSNIERELNDLLMNTNGYLRALANMIGIKDGMDFAHAEFPKQCDVDKTADNAFKLIKFKAEGAVRKIAGVRERDPVLRDARRMTNQYAHMLRQVKPAIDCAPGIALASDWCMSYWLLVTDRGTDEAKQKGILEWQEAVRRFAKLTAS